jgi:hypothetical protein
LCVAPPKGDLCGAASGVFPVLYVFPDGTRIDSDSALRFRSQTELEDSLAHAGFGVLAIRDAPDRPHREFVFLAQKTD